MFSVAAGSVRNGSLFVHLMTARQLSTALTVTLYYMISFNCVQQELVDGKEILQHFSS
jgi:hypothetical protein